MCYSSQSGSAVHFPYLALFRGRNKHFICLDMNLEQATRWLSRREWSNLPFPAYLIFPNKHLGIALSLGWLPGKLNGTSQQPAKTKLPHRHNAETLKQIPIS